MSVPSGSGPVADPAQLVAFLSRASTFDDGPVSHIQTHISEVFLTDHYAYKLKRPVKLHFLDFSTLERRHSAALREIEVNQSNAPEIYIGLVPVTHDGQRLFVDGPGEVVDWLVKMKRFEERTVFSNLVRKGGLKSALIEDLAEQVARIHLSTERKKTFGGYASVLATANGVFATLESFVGSCYRLDELKRLEHDLRRALSAQKRRIDVRHRIGFVRHCHGDMHLGNICLVNGRPTLFDAIEFREDFAAIDVLYDLAFPVMDLVAEGRPDLANLLLNRYLEVTCDYSGLKLLPVFVAIRAGVRAMVHVLEAQSAADPAKELVRARRYFDLAQEVLNPRPVRLLAVGGLSGTGKSTLARTLAAGAAAGAAAEAAAETAAEVFGPLGAIVLRSDAIRKRLFRQSASVPLPERAYTPHFDQRVFREMCRDTHRALGAGFSVIMDATFLDPNRRHNVETLARRKQVPFQGYWLEAEVDTLKDRVSRRQNDVSDADASVISAQTKRDLGPLRWERVDAGGGRREVVDQVLESLAQVNGN